jgi:hypothetical protein
MATTRKTRAPKGQDAPTKPTASAAPAPAKQDAPPATQEDAAAAVKLKAIKNVPGSMFGDGEKYGPMARSRADAGSTFEATEEQAGRLVRINYAERVED